MLNYTVSSNLGKFRLIAFIEGISYLLSTGYSNAVKIPIRQFSGDEIHGLWPMGILFILYCLLLLKVWTQYSWKFNKVVFAFIASLIPFGTFYLEAKLKKEAAI